MAVGDNYYRHPTRTQRVLSLPKTETLKHYFAVNTGVLESETLAPFLFIIVLDYVLRQAMCNAELGVTGSCQLAEYLTDFDFAHDVALVSETVADAQLQPQLVQPVEDEGDDHR